MNSRPRILLLAAAVTAAWAVFAAALQASAPETIAAASSVGRNYARASGPRVDPIVAPARIAKVAVVPGSKTGEAWAFGHTHARREGYAQTDPQGQGVFLRYTNLTGWQIVGTLTNPDGLPTNPGVSAFAIASNGEGWGVGGTGLVFHKKAASSQWQIDAGASSLVSGDLTSVSLKRDADGVYGFAVGSGPAFLKLQDGRWMRDTAGGVNAGADLLGTVVSVATIDRNNAWAIGQGSRELVLWQRTAQGWARALTGEALFDSAPSANQSSGGSPIINQVVSGGAVAEADGVVWVTGSLQPIDAQRYVNQRGPGSDPTRPFALRRDRNGVWTSFCPPIYQVSSSGVSSTAHLCDQPFPLATGSLPALDAIRGDEVFAGGFGLFHFTRGRWVREPNVAGIVSSLAFHSGSEGWISSYGNRTGEGLAGSTSITVGHWTTQAQRRPQLKRWPYPSRRVVEAVSLSPAGDGAAVAVGGNGMILHLTPGVGWDVVASPAAEALHDVVWITPALAFAVGEGGTILRFNGSRWLRQKSPTTRALYSLAFRGPSEGYAVGDKGTILQWDGAAWRANDSGTDKRLNAVDVAGEETVAVGDRGTILVKSAGAWLLDASAPERFKTGQEGLAPNLLSVTGLADGRAFAGGSASLLIERASRGRFERSSLPILSGSIHTLKALTVAGKVKLIASIGGTPGKFAGPGIVEPQGWLFVGDQRGWRSVGEQRVSATGPEIDAPVRRDAVYDVAIDVQGDGFAVGGFPADLVDDDGHLGSESSGSIWRFSLEAIPDAAPGTESVSIKTPPGTLSFAFLSDSACTDGLCSAAMGSGARADEVLAKALADIRRAADLGSVRFAALGGDMRRLGIPDELAPMKGLLDGIGVPAYAAIGDRDLFGPDGVLASNGYYLRAFADRPAPWGEGSAPDGIVPATFAGNGTAESGSARTHYAFDVRAGGRKVLRMVFIDTSRSPFVATAQNPKGDQVAWLQAALTDARTLSLPTVVVMHQPMVTPVSNAAEAATITTALTSGGALAVLTGHDRVNGRMIAPAAGAPGAFALYSSGSAGAALGGEWKPERGGYHAWQLVSITTGASNPRVTVRSIPILESVALSAPDGRSAGAGKAVRFRALGRLPDVGGGHLNGAGGDPNQVRAQYLPLLLPRRCQGLLAGDGCTPQDVLAPDARFFCRDSRVCEFVQEDPSRPGTPLRDPQGNLVRDQQSGLLCALQPGRTHVVVTAGSVSARVPFSVAGGEGPCVPGRVVDPPVPGVVRPSSVDVPVQVQGVKEKAAGPVLKAKTFEVAAVPVIAPPPVQPAPAPPGGGAPKYEEEREAATEKSEMTALPAGARAPSPWSGGLIGLVVVLVVGGLAGRMRPKTATAVARSRNAYATTRLKR